MLNINIPWKDQADIKGVKVTKIGFRNYSEEIAERTDFRGRSYYWIGGIYKGFEKLEDSDCMAIENSFISISPIKVNDYGIPHEILMNETREFLKKL
jgi:5'-nucleotidase